MIKKLFSFVLVISIFLFSFNKSFCRIAADDDCDRACLIRQAKQKQQELTKKMNEAKEDYEEYIALANEFASSVEVLEAEIDELEPQIEELNLHIEELTKDIEDNQLLVDKLNQRVLQRMRDAQGTMHFNKYLDFLLGSKGFVDLLRRIYGLEAINSKEESDRNELIDIIETLNNQKTELALAKEELDDKKTDLEIKQQEANTMRAYYTAAAKEADERVDDYRNQIDEQISIAASLGLTTSDLGLLAANSGFQSPVPGSSISAYFPYYPESFGGGVHLGVDYAAGVGTNIYAPADGVIIISDDNCPTYGKLGNSCGGAGGGVSYGGNQLYFLCSVNGRVYALTFSHLYSGSVHGTGVVSCGEQIARVGSSGNSSGPHCHIEMFYLGLGDNEDLSTYISRLNNGYYSLSFNCGWGSAGLNTICSNKGSAPCRLNGAEYLPG